MALFCGCSLCDLGTPRSLRHSLVEVEDESAHLLVPLWRPGHCDGSFSSRWFMGSGFALGVSLCFQVLV